MYLSGNLLRRGTGLRQETVRFFLHPVITAVGHTILLLDAVYDLLYLAEHCFDRSSSTIVPFTDRNSHM